MLRSSARPIAAVLAAAFLVAPSSFAFDTPLSDEAIREAYFLGQRHDETYASFFGKYTKHLPLPTSGPYISSLTFFTPFALVAQLSNQHSVGYSAQQAALAHGNQPESVRIVVQIDLTASYGPYFAHPTSSRSGSPTGITPRSSDFWKDFNLQVSNGNQKLKPLSTLGQSNFLCSDDGCSLSGATIQVAPPEGDPVSVDFDLTSLR